VRLHWLQHVPFEGLGCIEPWAAAKAFDISCTRLFADEPLPAIGTFDWLVIMGGPMGIYDLDEHPWLAAEKKFIKSSIDAGKTVLGICLGAQLIADVLGAKVYPGPQKEIGWFPIRRAENAPELIPAELTAFHWHGDTFDLPLGTIRIASSKACRNQGFVYDNRVVALQFHLETTPESMEALIEHCAGELPSNVDGASSSVTHEPPIDSNETGCSGYIQTTEQMRSNISSMADINTAMDDLLNALFTQ
jgi:GMP synthase-like glutamine amidotransferase